jgi:hypothetical protein
MGMIICKSCFESEILSFKKPFDPNPGELERVPDYNENVQHYSVYTVADIASKLNPGEMMEVLCTHCKRTHVGKDENGTIKVKYVGGDWIDWV